MPYGVVYVITNKRDGKYYVGQTTLPLLKRWANHKADSRRLRKPCRVLGSALQKHGPDSFEIREVAKAHSKQDLDLLERRWIADLNSLVPNGYNLKPGGEGGGSPSAETRKRMSDAQRGISKPGYPHTEDTKRRIAESQTGAKNHAFGKKLSAEHRRKCSEALRGEGNPNFGKRMSVEQRQKISFAKKGVKRTPEAIEKSAAAHRGRKNTAETIERMRVAAIKRWNTRRGKS